MRLSEIPVEEEDDVYVPITKTEIFTRYGFKVLEYLDHKIVKYPKKIETSLGRHITVDPNHIFVIEALEIKNIERGDLIDIPAVCMNLDFDPSKTKDFGYWYGLFLAGKENFKTEYLREYWRHLGHSLFGSELESILQRESTEKIPPSRLLGSEEYRKAIISGLIEGNGGILSQAPYTPCIKIFTFSNVLKMQILMLLNSVNIQNVDIKEQKNNDEVRYVLTIYPSFCPDLDLIQPRSIEKFNEFQRYHTTREISKRQKVLRISIEGKTEIFRPSMRSKFDSFMTAEGINNSDDRYNN